MRLWSAPPSSRRLRSPRMRRTDRGCRIASALLKKTNLFAAGPVTSTVGVPNNESFDTGPYRSTRSWIHRSAVLLRMARRKPRLCG
ncbi:hypothetical protein PR202_gb20999 [Eleusine coracana subsp. coracana]|uniref:Uncharacterized protein n=1 Tax=Eleusine coracana subsp. coracana TaxID=191504 RepID=A0AAV5FDL7_ELECO|nr:hypothetical protein PR202_gb20999 [Eleusine coracana subsp. coracana]